VEARGLEDLSGDLVDLRIAIGLGTQIESVPFVAAL